MAKKAAKKEAKHPLVKTPKKKYDNHVKIIGILVIVIALILYLTLNKAPSKDVLAIVNGQEITADDLELVKKFLPDDQKAAATAETLLQQTIDEVLLLQDAEKKGIAASKEEVDQAYKEALQRSGQTEQDVEALLAEKNITKEDVTAFFKKQVIFAKLIKLTPELQVTVTEAEMRSFYEQNRDQIPAPYEAAKEQVMKFIENSKLSQAFAAYLDNLRKEADVNIIESKSNQ